MTKVCSVHVSFIKGRIAEDVVHAMLAEKVADKVDYQMVWIDSFSYNTGQGGYKTVCTVEANLTLSKKKILS